MTDYQFFNEKVSPILVKWLNEEIRFYLFADIGQIYFAYASDFASKEIAAQCNYERREIVFNIAWIKERFKKNEIFLVKYLIMHEIRHFYQRRVVESFKNQENVRIYEPQAMLLSWQKNFEKYIDITGSSEVEEKNYFSQPVELDATAFAYYLMQHLHPNINPRSLYVPKYAVDYIKKSRGFYQSFFQVADQNKRYYF